MDVRLFVFSRNNLFRSRTSPLLEFSTTKRAWTTDKSQTSALLKKRKTLKVNFFQKNVHRIGMSLETILTFFKKVNIFIHVIRATWSRSRFRPHHTSADSFYILIRNWYVESTWWCKNVNSLCTQLINETLLIIEDWSYSE